MLDVISWIIGSGKGSRLNRLIVEKLELATQIESFAYDLSDYGLFIITYQPREMNDIPRITDLVNQELEKIAENGCTDAELKRACKKTEIDFISMTEDPERCAYLLGKYYLATKDENYLLNYKNESEGINEQVKNFTQHYLRQASMHQGVILSLPEKEKHLWADLKNDPMKRIFVCFRA